MRAPSPRRMLEAVQTIPQTDALLADAVGAWGSYDQDDPFPLFDALREQGAVHAVTLADGHDAWLVVRYAEARAALNDARLSKDMQAALADGAGVVAEGLPGPAFARHMLNVDPPDHTRLRRLVAAAFTHESESRRCGRTSSRSSTSCSTTSRRTGPDATVDLVERFAFPLPVHRHLRAARRAGGATGNGSGPASRPCSARRRHPRRTRAAKAASDVVVGMLRSLVDAKQTAARRRPRERARRSPRRRRAPRPTQELLSTIFQLIVAGHETTDEPHRQRRRRPAPTIPSSWRRCAPTRPGCRPRSRS